MLSQDSEASLSAEKASRAFAIDGNPRLFKEAAVVLRIRLAGLLDPMAAVTSSDVELYPPLARTKAPEPPVARVWLSPGVRPSRVRCNRKS